MKVTKLSLTLVAAALVAMLATAALGGSKETKSETLVLTSDNTIVLNTQVDGESVGQVIAKAKELDAKANEGIRGKLSGSQKPLYLFLNTPGGSIQSGLELIEALNGMGRPINTVTMFAASMGFQIAQNLGDRLILKNGVLMSHRASGGFEGSFGGKSPSQIESRYRFWLQRLTEMDEQTVKRTGGKQTLKSYQEAYADEMWLTGAQSVQGGYADRVVNVKCDSSLSGSTTHELMFFGLRVQYDLDNCPLNTAPMNIRIGMETTRGYMNSDDFIKQGGQFGPACLVGQDASTRLCALDTSLNLDKIKQLKSSFSNEYEKKQRAIVRNYGVF